MTPTLIVLALIVLGVAIVAWATRRKPAAPPEQRVDKDTAWNDPVTPADAESEAAPDPFANAPLSAPDETEPRR